MLSTSFGFLDFSGHSGAFSLEVGLVERADNSKQT